jgi:hypothetical protein
MVRVLQLQKDWESEVSEVVVVLEVEAEVC